MEQQTLSKLESGSGTGRDEEKMDSWIHTDKSPEMRVEYLDYPSSSYNNGIMVRNPNQIPFSSTGPLFQEQNFYYTNSADLYYGEAGLVAPSLYTQTLPPPVNQQTEQYYSHYQSDYGLYHPGVPYPQYYTTEYIPTPPSAYHHQTSQPIYDSPSELCLQCYGYPVQGNCAACLKKT